MKRSAKLIAILALLIPAAAFASWWNNDWKFRKEISFDLTPTGADIAATPQDVPVLVRFSLANFSYFNDTKPDGADFRVLAGDDKTPLKFHFEKYDPQNQMAFLWVHVPQMTGGAKSDKIYAYYGNPDAPAAADVPGTYDAQQVLVLSFAEASGIPMDSTAYKNNPSASTAELTPASLIAGGAKFDGKESITVPATASLRLLPNQGLTASAWVRIEQAQQSVVLALADQGKSIELDLDGVKPVVRAALGGAPATVEATADLSLSQWHHLAFTAAAGKLTLYVDGVAAGSAPVTLEEVGGTFSVGALNGAKFVAGEVDEVQVSKVVRSAEWIKAGGAQPGHGFEPGGLRCGWPARGGRPDDLLHDDREELDAGWLGGDRHLHGHARGRAHHHGAQGGLPDPRRVRQRQIPQGVPPSLGQERHGAR